MFLERKAPEPVDRSLCQNTFRAGLHASPGGPLLGTACNQVARWVSPDGLPYCDECVKDAYQWGLSDGQYGWKLIPE